MRDVGSHAQVAVQGQLAAAGNRVTMDHGDGRVARALDALERLDHAALGIARRAALLLHLAQVHAGAEGRARAADHDHAHLA